MNQSNEECYHENKVNHFIKEAIGKNVFDEERIIRNSDLNSSVSLRIIPYCLSKKIMFIQTIIFCFFFWIVIIVLKKLLKK